MGLEAKTTAIVGRKRFAGELHLDSKSLTFKSSDFKWVAELGKSIAANATKDRLIVEQDGKQTSFEVGPSAQKWVDKILNPPNRITKLGVKPDDKLWVSAGFQKSFKDELKRRGATIKRSIKHCDLAFWKVTHRDQLFEFKDLADELPDGINIWIIWTKGCKSIGQTDVMTRAKALGFGPSKTAAFDEDHSSMRFAQKSKRIHGAKII